jgi:hypothetical protein
LPPPDAGTVGFAFAVAPIVFAAFAEAEALSSLAAASTLSAAVCFFCSVVRLAKVRRPKSWATVFLRNSLKF